MLFTFVMHVMLFTFVMCFYVDVLYLFDCLRNFVLFDWLLITQRFNLQQSYVFLKVILYNIYI